jgi:hypothetical protein
MTNKETNSAFQFSPAFDSAFLNELFADDLKYAAVVFGDFLTEMPVCCDEMTTAFQNNDIPGLRSSAHKCKTLFAYVGLNAISSQLQALETACSYLETTQTIQPLFQELLKQKPAIEQMISEEIKRLEAYYEK